MALAAGINGALALHLLGAAPQIPVSEFRRFMPVMWFGFWLNAASGLALFIAYPTKAITNPIFWVKLTLIACAMWVFTLVRGVRLQPDPHAVVRSVRLQPDLLALVSLACWAGAIVAGRLLAYTYTRLMADW